MTTITGGATGTNNSFDSDSLEGIASGTLSGNTSSQFTLSDSAFSLTAQGSGIGYSGGHPNSGTITSLTYETGGDPSSWSNFSVSVSSAWNAISNGDVNSFYSLFFGGNDTFNMQASTAPDFLKGGDGNDTFNYNGNLSGFTQIDGGAGTDTLSLNGDYYGYNPLGYVTNVEIFKLAAGHHYSLAYAPASALTVDASALQAGDSVNFENLGGSGTLTMNGGAGNDTLIVHPGGANIFNGGGGSDTIDFSPATSGVTVNLSLTTAQSVGGGMGSDTLNSVENIVGTTFNDTLTGNSADNTFYAIGPNAFTDDTGIDTYNGGTGYDTVSFQNLPYMTHGVTIDMRTGSSHTAGTDTFISIEKVIGSPLSDTFIGNSDNNYFDGVDTQYADTVDYEFATGGMTFTQQSDGAIMATGGGQGTDTIVNCVIFEGTDYNDTFYLTQAGASLSIDGRGGLNTVSFQNATGNVVFGIGGPNVQNIQNVTGSAFNDTINGDNGNNVLNGGTGNDTIYGDSYGGEIGGNDVINGGDGNDTLYGGSGSIGDYGNDNLNGGNGDDTLYGGGYNNDSNGKDILDGGAGNDKFYGGANDIVTYQDATSGVTVDLSSNDPQNVGGGMGTDTLEFISNVQGSNFNDTLHGNDYNNVLNGMDGNDVIDISSNGPIFARGGSDTVWGGNGDDTIIAGPDLTADDKIDGGPGTDTLTLNGDYSAGLVFSATTMVNVEVLKLVGPDNYNLTLDDANVAAGQTLLVDGSILSTGNTFVFNGSHETNGKFVVEAGAGQDTLLGGAGNDTFVFGASVNAADTVDGGAGSDTVELNGDFSAGLTVAAALLTNIETLRLDAGHNYSLTMSGADVAPGKTLTVDASSLGVGNTLTFDGSHETSGSFVVNGGAGNDVLAGGAGNDTLNGGGGIDTVNYANATSAVSVNLLLSTAQNVGGGAGFDTLISIENLTGSNFNDTLHGNSANNVLSGLGGNDTFYMGDGGIDTVSGGDGNDTIFFVAALIAADTIDGGAGTDTVWLNGDYAGANAVVFAPTTMTNVENISLVAGHSYSLTTNNANVAAGQTLTISGSALGAADALTFNGSQETDGKFIVYGGAGADVLKGGSGNDTFNMGAFLTAADVIDGGAGTDTLSLNGNYTGAKALVFNATSVTHIETISLTAGHSYDLTTNNATVAAGQTLTINGALLGASDTLTFSGASETKGSFIINGGAGNDALVGGAGSDTITGGAGNDTLTGGGGADQLNGGSGANIFVYKNAAQSTGAHYDTITGFDFTADKFDLTFAVSAIDAKIAGGALSAASFDSDLAAAVDAAHLGKHHAVLFTPNSGDLAGDTFLVIDSNRVAGYQAGKDIVIQLNHPGHLASLDVTDFI